MGVAVYARIRPVEGDGVSIPFSDDSIEWGGREYAFARVFPPACSTAQLFDAEFEPMVRRAAEGFDSAVFAYGQTGSGKTHTVFGDAASPGLARLAATSLFDLIRARPNCTFALKVSLMEILDEKATDLLHHNTPVVFRTAVAPSDGTGSSGARSLVFHGLRERSVMSERALVDTLEEGLAGRTVAANYRHDFSSRSHVVLRIVVEAAHLLALGDGSLAAPGAASPADADPVPAPDGAALPDGASPDGTPQAQPQAQPQAGGGSLPVVTCGSFCLVDLAGSESASLNASSAVAAQGAGINKSLLFLRQAVRAMGGPGASAGSGAAAATPPSLRNSLLTRLLEPALSGSAELAMICALPATLTPQQAEAGGGCVSASASGGLAGAVGSSAKLDSRQVVDALEFAQSVSAVRQTAGSSRNIGGSGAGELRRLHALLLEMAAERDTAAGGVEALNLRISEYALLVEAQRARTVSAESLAEAEREAASAGAAERVRLERQAAALAEALAEEEARRMSTHDALAGAEARLAQTEARTAQLSAQLELAAAERARLAEALGGVELKLASATEEVGHKQSALGTARDGLAARELELSARAAELGARETELAQLGEAHANLERALRERDADLAALSARAAAVERSFDAQTADLQLKDAQLCELRLAQEALSAAVDEAEKRAREAQSTAELAAAASAQANDEMSVRLRANAQLLLLKHKLHSARIAARRHGDSDARPSGAQTERSARPPTTRLLDDRP